MANSPKRMVTFLSGNGSPMSSQKQQRNESCKCGSGKKAKKCCGCDTEYYHTKGTKSQKDKPVNHPVNYLISSNFFQSGRKYYCKHDPSGEQWVIIGISHDFRKVCAAGWLPSIGELSDCSNWEIAGQLSEEEIKYRNKQFGTSNWIWIDAFYIQNSKS